MSLFSNITLGQYYPGNTPLHRLDPRAKLLLMPLVIAGIMLANNWATYTVAVLPVLLGLLLSKVPFHFYLRGMKFLWLFLLIGLILQSITYPGETLCQWGIISVSKEGLYSGIKLVYRLSFLVIAGMLLTMTTTPVNLTSAMEKLLTPFKRVGVPAHELSMMMTIALRFIPTLLEEADTVVKAQQARGGSLASGSFTLRLKASVAMLVPLLAGSLRKADDLAMAMEARCYRGDIGRTRLKQFSYQKLDLAAGLIILISTTLIILNRWYW